LDIDDILAIFPLFITGKVPIPAKVTVLPSEDKLKTGSNWMTIASVDWITADDFKLKRRLDIDWTVALDIVNRLKMFGWIPAIESWQLSKLPWLLEEVREIKLFSGFVEGGSSNSKINVFLKAKTNEYWSKYWILYYLQRLILRQKKIRVTHQRMLNRPDKMKAFRELANTHLYYLVFD